MSSAYSCVNNVQERRIFNISGRLNTGDVVKYILVIIKWYTKSYIYQEAFKCGLLSEVNKC